ncbi:hypothetical protein EXS70_04435 [Candidatus Peribacteria bacterium]|nr:hypothetical protein [Candidatus Peribacteria bacterium]
MNTEATPVVHPAAEDPNRPLTPDEEQSFRQLVNERLSQADTVSVHIGMTAFTTVKSLDAILLQPVLEEYRKSSFNAEVRGVLKTPEALRVKLKAPTGEAAAK